MGKERDAIAHQRGAVLPLYNGNIAETFWKTSSDNIVRKYGYSYDYQNRLLAAFYQKPTTTVPRADSYSTGYSYDRNGNILSLKRNGQRDMATQVVAIDDLDYTYDAGGNQLQKVFDRTNHPAGFNMNGAGANDTFVYDKYGNLIADPYKKISNILYNHLNLPSKITFLSGGKIEYFYDGTGIKLKKKVTDGTTITTTEYMQGFQYTNNVLDFFPHAEGYVKALPASLGGGSSYQFKYVFTYTDHLGNIRLKYAQDPSNNNQISILEEDHYYPYGLKHSGYNSFHQIFTTEDGDLGPGTGIVLTPVNPFLGDSHKYKFGGMEYQDEFDVDMYDFGARNYDPALGRWMNIDPLAEMMRRHSPYNYAFNNPVYFIDPDGMSPLPVAVTSIGMGVDGVKDIRAGGSGGFDVRTYDRDGNTLDSVTVNDKQGVDINADGDITKNDRQTPGDGGGADVSLGGGGCPHGDCGEKIQSKQNGSSYFKKALALSAVLVADDVTGVGVADDVLIPVILIGGLILDKINDSGNENYPGPWTETQPDPGKFPYSQGYQGGDNKNFFPQGNGNQYTKWIIRIGGGAALGKRLYEGFRPHIQDNTNIKRPEYYIP